MRIPIYGAFNHRGGPIGYLELFEGHSLPWDSSLAYAGEGEEVLELGLILKGDALGFRLGLVFERGA